MDRIFRPVEVPDTGMLCDMLWSDPDKNATGWIRNERGVSFAFGKKVLSTFLKKNKIDLICRAHQVVEDGYEFFGNRKLVTVFSAPNYCGEFDNNGGMLKVNENLMCSFKILKAKSKGEMKKAKTKFGILNSLTKKKKKKKHVKKKKK